MAFKWHPNEPPPVIEPHSKAKLEVLRRYLRAYLDRLNVNPLREEFKLDLVDGFSGGGIFRDGNAPVSGTPLIMLEESKAAIDRLSQNRTKSPRFDFKYYFVDATAAHTDCLRKVLNERDYQAEREEIVIRNSRFEDAVGDIIAEIRRRQPRSGRSIFLLDQFGYSTVPLELISRIFQKLPTAEVILTFAADNLTNFLAAKPAMVQAVSRLGLTAQRVRELVRLKEGDGGRALVQRELRRDIRSKTGATYDTPFFIRPRQSRRALWFLHLSRHPTARDVMIQCHWNSFNTFEHYGSGDFEMLGWDSLISAGGTLPLFHFEEAEAKEMRSQLLNSMPRELYSLASEKPLSVNAMRHAFANRTAARFSDFSSVVLELFQYKEIDILNADGKRRSRRLQTLGNHDRIAIPRMPLLPNLSRRR